jgi:hypothetical protein
MRRFVVVTSIAVVAAAAGVAGVGGAAVAQEQATFRANLKGKALASGAIQQKGTVTSARFGDGRMSTRSVPDGSRAQTYTATSKLRLNGGTVRTRGTMTVVMKGSWYTLTGTARVTGGTGRYRHAAGRLRVRGTGKSDLSSLRLTMTGDISR